MEIPSHVALSRQMALAREMEVVANDVANASTPGFKGQSVSFAEHLAKAAGAPGGRGGVSFVKDAGTSRDMSQGPLTHTGNTFDVALEGAGYLSVETPAGERWTRNGRLSLNADGELVTAQGHRVMGQGGPIAVPPGETDVRIAADGTVSGRDGELGRLRVVRFEDERQVVPAGANLVVTSQVPQEVTDGSTKVRQGMVEESNVQPIVAMTRLMGIQRDVLAAKELMDAEHQRISNAIDRLGKTS